MHDNDTPVAHSPTRSKHRLAGVAMHGLFLAVLLSAASPAPAEILRLHGSNTLGETLAPALVEAWFAGRGCTGTERHPLAPGHIRLVGTGGCDLEVDLQTHGSGTGIAGLLDGRTDLAMSSRPVTADETRTGQQRGLGDLASPAQEGVVALDGVAVIVHPDNPLKELRVDQVRGLFDGSVRNWQQLGGRAGVVRVHARDDASGTYETFRTLVLGSHALRSDAVRYESTQALARAVVSDPNAIGFVGIAGVGQAQALAIADAGVAMLPQPFRIAVEDYPLARRLFLYRARETTPLALEFERFVQSSTGQALAEKIGLVSQDIRAYPDSARTDAPTNYRELVAGADRLSVNFRFGRSGGLIDSKTGRDVERLQQFMAKPENQGQRLLLMGFVDKNEVAPMMAQLLSNDRADYIANLLTNRGVPVRRVRGMGGSAPLSADDGEAGRYRNRRVEVWIEAKPGQDSVLAQ